ncbi:MAG: beta-N-acetylglucosaminidase domain-containing protein, partial [Paramuribaculum sp.]|nr:beta-N-acetylglucosaminidase domain-containing protein [Paramuribaculum sp.]
MNIFKKLLPVTALIALSPAVHAQDESFDLSSQRGEVQEYNAVPGHKLDHKGIIINPTPQHLDVHAMSVLNVGKGYKINDSKKSFSDAVGFLTPGKKGVKVNIDFDADKSQKAGVKAVSGAYLLTISPKGIDILGYDKRGAFYGLQTLRQIISSPASADGKLPLLTVNDYPSMKYRGVVEGFYGTPWSHEVRMSLLDFYGRNKMNDYLYGPKDDPYHSSPYWRQPYPEDQAKKIKELVQNARRNHVNFIWAIHPGKDIRWNKLDYDSLVNKFNMMYDLGVRSFAIFFDDIEGEGTNPQRQVELLNTLTEDFVKAKGDVTNLIVCPTDYSQLWAKPGPDGPLAVYGKSLNPDVEVFWTGAVVCSDLTHETLEFVNSRIKRPALYWWNYPVTDYCKHIVIQGPVYGLATDLTESEVAGIESNPMEHGEASKLALYGVADYAWNPNAYNPIDNWERGIVELMPEAADAYRTFAIHSTDTETGYRRDESWETEIFPVGKYTPAQFEALSNEFRKITGVEKAIRNNATNKALVNELSPWLTQFTKLGERGLRTLELIKIYESGNDSVFWTNYAANLMSDDDKTAYEAHKIGTMKLQPFYERSMDDMVYHFFHKLTGIRPAIYKGIGTYPNLRTSLS